MQRHGQQRSRHDGIFKHRGDFIGTERTRHEKDDRSEAAKVKESDRPEIEHARQHDTGNRADFCDNVF